MHDTIVGWLSYLFRFFNHVVKSLIQYIYIYIYIYNKIKCKTLFTQDFKERSGVQSKKERKELCYIVLLSYRLFWDYDCSLA